MATVHLGRLSGPAGFSRTVAIKRLHPNFAKDADFVAMFLDEARLAARIRHPNVVPTLDVVATDDEVFLVMDYVQGESLSKLRRAIAGRGQATDTRIVAAVMSGVLHGLHAAHIATDEHGESLDIVHRDVSPQNILVGADGAARLLDFGVAKAMGRAQTTQDGKVKGKLAYMPPEQLNGGVVTRQADVYAAAVVTWEALTGQRLFHADHQAAILAAIFQKRVPLPSAVAPRVPAAFDRVVMRGLERDPKRRYATAREMAVDLERCAGVASASEVGAWVESLAGPELAKRAALVAEVESAAAPRAQARDGSALPSLVPATPVNLSSPPWAASRFPPATPSGFREISRRQVEKFGWGAGAVVAALVIGLSVRHHTHVAPPAELTTEAGSPVEPFSPPPLFGMPLLPLPQDAATSSEPAPASKVVAATTPHPSAVVNRVPPRSTRNGCDPPFTIDEKGHKHFKSTCLP